MTTKPILLVVLWALLSLPVQAQDALDLLYESEPGVRPAPGLQFEIQVGTSKLDATGDGQPELITTREDDGGNVTGLRVIDVATGDVVWAVPDVSSTICAGAPTCQFYGFADPGGMGAPHGMFATDDRVLAVDLASSTVTHFAGPVDFVMDLVAIVDLTGDGVEEIVLHAPNIPIVQIWGDPHVDLMND
ncbi:MAG: hypothetical protein GVY18_08440 [Bacteroidetes bacterium]|jgi:hypothetical protein|nr:hypothetical protein [Bacteroidota bacterium]